MGLLSRLFGRKDKASGGGARKDSGLDDLGKVGGGFGGGGGGLRTGTEQTQTTAPSPASPAGQTTATAQGRGGFGGGGGGGARKSSAVPSTEQVQATDNPKALVDLAEVVSGNSMREAQDRTGREPAIGKTKDNWRSKLGGAIADYYIAPPIIAAKRVAGYDNPEQQEIEESDVRASSRRFVNRATWGLLSPGTTGSLTGSGQAMNIGAEALGLVAQNAEVDWAANKLVNFAMNKWGKTLNVVDDLKVKTTTTTTESGVLGKTKYAGSGISTKSLGKIKGSQEFNIEGTLETLSKSAGKIPGTNIKGSTGITQGESFLTYSDEAFKTKGILSKIDDVTGALSSSKKRTLIKGPFGEIAQVKTDAVSGTLDRIRESTSGGAFASKGMRSGKFTISEFVGKVFSPDKSTILSGTQGVLVTEGPATTRFLGNTLGKTAPGFPGIVEVSRVKEITGTVSKGVISAVSGLTVPVVTNVNVAPVLFGGGLVLKSWGGVVSESKPGIKTKSEIKFTGVSAGTAPQPTGIGSFEMPKSRLEVPRAFGGIEYPMQDVNQGGMWARSSDRGSKQKRRTDTGMVSGIENLQVPEVLTKTKVDVAPARAFRTAQTTKTAQKFTGSQMFNFDFGVKVGPKIGGVGGFGLPDFGGFGESKGKGISDKIGGAFGKYTPSLGGLFTGKKGKTGNLKGFEIRGLPKGWKL